ncbi:transmembrane protein 220 [Sesamum indicum]|uniref:Transmembrane protein 220 n=1 Tax=Sesamum indicum TaxID=4182 RepID=A0A6I9TQ06_SESIN|nr:transmembrane protein 220 [Sesamum indicum]
MKRSLLGVCCLSMAVLFAVSACFQFNDPDWYFWIPLYVTASVVNMVNWENPPDSRTRKTGRFAFWLGVLLLVKVSVQGFVHGRDGFWSLDMRDRVVREKFGSGLVVISMFLYLDTSNNSTHHPTRLRLAKYGMPILVGVAYGLSFVFFGFQHKEMRY